MNPPKNLLLTGASGFVGQRYVEINKEQQIKTVSLRTTSVDDINFQSINVIVHLAGIAHQMTKIDDQIYYDVNHKKTLALAKNSKEAGVAHFIFISTVKVYGDHPDTDYLDLSSPTVPTDAYGKSKLLAEQDLLELQDASFCVSIIRPPLVYGPGVKGNMIRFLNLANKNLPIPFKGIANQRSMVYLDNLIALIDTVIDRKQAGIFIAGDNQPLSTSDLLSHMYNGLEIKPKWFKMPRILKWALNLIKPELIKRLYGSYVIDNTETNKLLNFNPPYTSQQGIKVMAEWYLKSITNDNA